MEALVKDEILGTMENFEKHIDESLLELFLLDEQFPEEQRRKIEKHLEHCSECQHKLAELIMFYDILREEMDKPIPEEVRKLVEKLQNKK